MDHIKVAFPPAKPDVTEMLIALLADIGYDGFEETEEGLYAYIGTEAYDTEQLNVQAAMLNIPFNTSIIPAQNWNALWESNFQPVIVADFCTVRAHFHDIKVMTKHDIVITPKMSFGTGHHATTQLMITQMRDMDIRGKSVLDFGTGTGILAILAEMLGANNITAIDNDKWSVDNAIENIARNDCKHIAISLGSLEVTAAYEFDVILANINRHILLQYMPQLYSKMKKGGQLLMSGLLTEDKDIMTAAAEAQQFDLVRYTEKDNWISLLFNKK